MTQNRKSILVLLVVTILLTSIIVTLSQSISQSYFKTHTFFWDPVMAYSRNIVFYERMEVEVDLNPIASRVNFAKLYFTGEPKAPIYGLPIILFAPKLLLSPWANLPVSSLMLAVFLFILGYSIFLRTKHTLLSIASMFLVSAAPVLFDPKWGIASSWYDFPSGFLLAAAIISLYKKESHFLKNIVKPTAIVVGIVLLLASYFLLYHFEFTLNYYSKMAYAISDSVIDCFKDFLIVFKMIGYTYSTSIFLLGIFLLYFFWIKTKKLNITNTIFFLWIVVSLPLFWIVLFKSVGNYNTNLIELPIIHILWLGIIPGVLNNKKIVNYICILLIVVSIIGMFFSYTNYLNNSKSVTQIEKKEKKLTQEISNQIKHLSPEKSWASFFAPDHSRIINCECFYNYKVFPKINKDVTFYGYSTYWKFFYKDKTVDEISQTICEGIEKSDVFITFNSKEDVNNAIKPNVLDDFKTTKQITYNVVDYMKNNPNWEKQEIISTKQYSNLALYRKK